MHLKALEAPLDTIVKLFVAASTPELEGNDIAALRKAHVDFNFVSQPTSFVGGDSGGDFPFFSDFGYEFGRVAAQNRIEGGSADHAFLGVTTTDASATVGETTYRGAEVVALEPDAPAAAGDLRDGDLITRVDDTPVGSAAALTGVVRGLEVGSTHTLTVLREDELQTLEVTLGSRSA